MDDSGRTSVRRHSLLQLIGAVARIHGGAQAEGGKYFVLAAGERAAHTHPLQAAFLNGQRQFVGDQIAFGDDHFQAIVVVEMDVQGGENRVVILVLQLGQLFLQQPDMVIVDFSQTSEGYDNYMLAKGGFVVNCNHGGGHCGAPAALQASAWQFMEDHPFGTHPSPYAAGLPSGFFPACKIFDKMTSVKLLGEGMGGGGMPPPMMP